MLLGVRVGEPVGTIVGHAVLGAPVWLEPLANVGYAVEGVSVGDSVGKPVGVTVGVTVGTWLGVMVGESVGEIVGHAELGAPVLPEPLANVGYAVDGTRVGDFVGESVGVMVGDLLGLSVGVMVGESVGAIVGHAVLGTPVWLEP
jgi:hypothetical protein